MKEPFPDLAAAVRAVLNGRRVGSKTGLAAAARISRSRLSLIRRGRYAVSPAVARALVRRLRLEARMCERRADVITAVLSGEAQIRGTVKPKATL